MFLDTVRSSEHGWGAVVSQECLKIKINEPGFVSHPGQYRYDHSPIVYSHCMHAPMQCFVKDRLQSYGRKLLFFFVAVLL